MILEKSESSGQMENMQQIANTLLSNNSLGGKGFLQIILGWEKCHVGEDIVSQGFLIRCFSDFGCYGC